MTPLPQFSVVRYGMPKRSASLRWISPEAAAISLVLRLQEAKMLPRADIRSDGISPAFSSHRINAKRFFKNFYKKDAAFFSRGAAAKWYILWTLKIRRDGIGAGDGIGRYLFNTRVRARILRAW